MIVLHGRQSKFFLIKLCTAINFCENNKLGIYAEVDPSLRDCPFGGGGEFKLESNQIDCIVDVVNHNSLDCFIVMDTTKYQPTRSRDDCWTTNEHRRARDIEVNLQGNNKAVHIVLDNNRQRSEDALELIKLLKNGSV